MLTTLVGTILLIIIMMIMERRDQPVLPEETSKHLIGSDEDDHNFKGDEDDEDKNDIKDLTLLEKVEKVKEKEKVRLIKDKKEVEEAERKRKEVQAKNFVELKPYLQDLKLNYANDKDIDIEFREPKAFILLKDLKKAWIKIIMIQPNDLDDSYCVETFEGLFEESTDWEDYDLWDEGEFYSSNELIDYIAEKVGIFLAERESS